MMCLRCLWLKAIAENKKLKAKLKDAEARITRHLQEVEHFKVPAAPVPAQLVYCHPQGDILPRSWRSKRRGMRPRTGCLERPCAESWRARLR